MRSFFRLLAGAALLSVAGASCTSQKAVTYFNSSNPVDSGVLRETAQEGPATVIRKDDILAINVTSISSITPEADPVKVFREGGAPFSITAGQAGGGASGGAAGGGANGGGGYLVDEQGFIDYPVLGKVKLEGLDVRAAKEELARRLKPYIKDPVVEVRILNFKVIVLGEVGRPGTLLAPNHKMTIMEAIAASGDIPITGRKDNVLVIRQNGNQREYGRINLTSREATRSPYWYLQQNDQVIVEPGLVRRQATNNFTQVYLPVFTTVLTTALALYTLVLVNRDNQ